MTKSAKWSITRPFHYNAPCGSTFGASQADGNVCSMVENEDPTDAREEVPQAVASGRSGICIEATQANSLDSPT